MSLCGAAEPDEAEDIIDETLKSFKSNIFFQSYDVKGPADRLLLFLTLYTSQALNRMTRVRKLRLDRAVLFVR